MLDMGGNTENPFITSLKLCKPSPTQLPSPPHTHTQLVVVSPLMRTLETAAGIFGVADPASAAVAAAGAEDMSEDGAQPAVLMLAQSEQASMRVAHEQLCVPPGGSFVAHELCRERLGPSHCDQRRPVTQAATCFPGVDFSLIDSDEDQLWAPGNVEAEAQVVHRGMKFLQVSAGGSGFGGGRAQRCVGLPDGENMCILKQAAPRAPTYHIFQTHPLSLSLLYSTHSGW